MTKNEAWTYFDCKNAIDFVEENFDMLAFEYNKTVNQENRLKANSIEYSAIIWLVEDENYGIYIDFNDKNGYIVMTGDYNIYDFHTEGDYIELRNIENLCYSYLDGFLYLDQDGLFQRIYQPEQVAAGGATMLTETDLSEAVSEETVYPGQSIAGDGQIAPANIKEYVSSRYPDYKFVSEVVGLSSDFKFSRQYTTSYYIKYYTDKDGNPNSSSSWSEGNCVLNSLYMTMLSWQQQGWLNNLPTYTANLSTTIYADSLYDYYGRGIVREGASGGKTPKTGSSGGEESAIYHKWQTNNYYLPQMPVLYSDIRNEAVSVYGYTPESNFIFNNLINVGKYVANNLYGNNIDIKSTSSISSALEYLSQNKAIFLGINNSTTYGNHGVVIIGYYLYSYTTEWNGFSYTKYAYFYEIADGWNLSSKVFDPNTSASPSLWAYYLG